MTEKNKDEMLNMLDVMLNEENSYGARLEAYEYLLEDCDEIVDQMLERSCGLEGDTGKMLMEVLAQYKGNKAIFMGLVSYLYKGEDVALFAHLIGSYGDEQGIAVLKTFCDEYEPNYNEFMEIRNAVEELGGDFDLKEDFSDDPLYRYLKGLDEEDDDRKSPFEDMWDDDDCDDCDDDCDGEGDCHHHDCGCHHEEGEEHDCGCHHGGADSTCGCHHDGDGHEHSCGCHNHEHGEGCGCHKHRHDGE